MRYADEFICAAENSATQSEMYEHGEWMSWVELMGTDHRNLKDRHFTCGFRKVKCPACDRVLLVNNVAAHESECPARIEDCKKEMKFSEYATLRNDQFGVFDPTPCRGVVLCPNQCVDSRGRTMLLLCENVSSHVSTCDRRFESSCCSLPLV